MRLLSLALLAGLFVGCTVSWRVSATAYVRPRSYVVVTSPCPAPRETASGLSDKPEPNAIYVSGHWTWNSGWVWVSGSWKVPRPGYVWEPPVCEGDDHFYPGYFRPTDEAPPPVYRQPDSRPMYCPPPAGATVTVRPAQPDTTVRPAGGTTTTTRPTGPDTTVRPAGGTTTTTQPTGPNTTVQPAGGTTTTTRPVGPDTTVQPSGGTTTTTRPVGPDTTVQPSGGTTTTRPVAPVALGCQIRIARVPRGGRIAIVGTGFTAQTTVEVGGSVAAVARWTATELSVEASSGGAVTVTRGGETASCGRVTVF